MLHIVIFEEFQRENVPNGSRRSEENDADFRGKPRSKRQERRRSPQINSREDGDWVPVARKQDEMPHPDMVPEHRQRSPERQRVPRSGEEMPSDVRPERRRRRSADRQRVPELFLVF